MSNNEQNTFISSECSCCHIGVSHKLTLVLCPCFCVYSAKCYQPVLGEPLYIEGTNFPARNTVTRFQKVTKRRIAFFECRQLLRLNGPFALYLESNPLELSQTRTPKKCFALCMQCNPNLVGYTEDKNQIYPFPDFYPICRSSRQSSAPNFLSSYNPIYSRALYSPHFNKLFGRSIINKDIDQI